MFGKVFAQMYEGSMMGAGPWVFALWPYIIANCDRRGYVELNPRLIAAKIGGSSADARSAIEYLAAPDPESRSKDEGGRRIAKEGEYLYRIVNYEKYRDIRNAENRREQNRVAAKKYREKDRQQPSAAVSNKRSISAKSAHAEAEAEAEVDTGGMQGGRNRKRQPVRGTRQARPRSPKIPFVPPTETELTAYIREKKYRFSAADFIEHYESNGWKVGRNPMVSWKAACHTFEVNVDKFGTPKATGQPRAKTDAELDADYEAKMEAFRLSQLIPRTQ